MKELLREAFPCEPRYILCGMDWGLSGMITLFYPNELVPSWLSALVFAAPFLVFSIWKEWKAHRSRFVGWIFAGFLAGAAPYSWIVPEGMGNSLYSSVSLLAVGLVLLAGYLLITRLRLRWSQEELPEDFTPRETEEEKRARKIAEENARHRR